MTSTPQTILVTGGAGYIGSHFVNRYLQQHPDNTVVIVDDLSTGNIEAIEILQAIYPHRAKFYRCTVGDDMMVNVLSRHPIEAVVHFAASALVGESQHEPMRYLNNNVGQTLLLLNHLQQVDIRHFVFSSTAAVYGVPPETSAIPEEAPKQPVNAYGQSKLLVENMLATLQERGQLGYIALRYFNAAGADDEALLGEGHTDETHLIPLVLQVATGKRPAIAVYGNDYPTPDGTCIRDFIHVTDLADAHISALNYLRQHPHAGEAFNLGTGHGASVQDVIETCKTITQKPIPTSQGPRRDGDPPVLVASPLKARRLLDWQARYPLEAIIRTAWQWEQNRQFCH